MTINPAMSIGGVPLYQMQGLIQGGVPVYRPEYGGAGLLGGAEEFDNGIRKHFAGGLLNGFQYDPRASQGERMLKPVAPSGMFTTDQSQGVSVESNSPRGLTNRDMLMAMYGANPDRFVTGVFGASKDRWDYFDKMMRGEELTGRAADQWNAYKVKLDGAYDPSSEGFQKLMSRVDGYGSFAGGNQDDDRGQFDRMGDVPDNPDDYGP